jgi:hypothetical protein
VVNALAVKNAVLEWHQHQLKDVLQDQNTKAFEMFRTSVFWWESVPEFDILHYMTLLLLLLY